MLSRLPKGGIAVEIGVWKGEFSKDILKLLKPEKLYLVDPWRNFEDQSGAFHANRKDLEFEKIYLSVVESFQDEIDSGGVEILRETSLQALKRFEENSVDFVYLDADHSYSAVKADFEAILPILKSGGVVMLDDYHRRGWFKDDVIVATNEFIGEHAKEVRVRIMLGAQIAIEKL